METIEKKLLPFVLGMAVGHYGLRWAYHIGYAGAVVLAFFVGKHWS